MFAGPNDYSAITELYLANQTDQAGVFAHMTYTVPAAIASVVQRLLTYGENNIFVFTIAPLDTT